MNKSENYRFKYKRENDQIKLKVTIERAIVDKPNKGNNNKCMCMTIINFSEL